MTTQVTKTRSSERLTLRDRLSRLTFLDACRLLGPQGKSLIQRSANLWEISIQDDVFLNDDLLRVRIPEEGGEASRGNSDGEPDGGPHDGPPIVTITRMALAKDRLHWNCTHCSTACQHVGAVFSLVLEEKTALGLAAGAAPRAPVESLDEESLVARALAERTERAKKEKMRVESLDATRPWTDYIVTSRLSGKTYRVALRGLGPGESYCSCPDFRGNTLGTCKHVLHVSQKIKRRFTARRLKTPFRPTALALHLRYDGDVTLRLLVPPNLDDAANRIIAPLKERAIEDVRDLVARLARLQKIEHDVLVYPDAEQFIQQRLFQERMRDKMAAIRRDPANHPLRTHLLKIPLLPYQMDGVAFAAGAGRAILADDMGLGKTIQGVGVAEILAREAGIRKVLIVCPASLKSQWRAEIQRFCEREAQLVGGPAAERHGQYGRECFFTICNYEQVPRDILAIERVAWDLTVLDEGQRIKNYEAKTSNVIKSLKSRFALVLSGTPLENRLDDLFSVVQFVDDRRLGPGFRFFNKHRVLDEKGKVLGYQHLADLRAALAPLLLRRTREGVKLELPPRTLEFVRVPPTDEQLELHAAHMRIVASITSKKFITEMDLLRLQKALLMCRMAADSTFLVDKQPPGFSSKLERLDELFEQIFAEDDRKVVLFSEWTTMLDLIEKLLVKRRLTFVRLDGSVPQKQRQALVHRFQTDPACRLFLTTNAGSTGLNLQAANTVINVDLPWNPAVLEQRIARAHRMGQTQSVQVFALVTEGTIEENLLATIAAKKDLFLAALDTESEVDKVDLSSGMEELKSRLEVLLGARREAPIDESVKQRAASEARDLETQREFGPKRERVASAAGELLGAAFKFLGELVTDQRPAPPPDSLVANIQSGLAACVEEDPAGRPRLTFTLPDKNALAGLAQTLAKLLAVGDSVGVGVAASPPGEGLRGDGSREQAPDEAATPAPFANDSAARDLAATVPAGMADP